VGGGQAASTDLRIRSLSVEISMRAEEYSTRTLELEGWKVRLSSYKIGSVYHCIADNVDPGAWIARAQGATREEAESLASERARELLGRTRRMPAG
jgi:hypothetical protein